MGATFHNLRIWALVFLTSAFVLSLWTSANGQASNSSSIIQSTSAKPIHRPKPRYPDEAADLGQEGWVLLNYVVKTDGTVGDISVEDTTGNKYLERAAIRTVRRWRFEPATLHGNPVEQCHTQIRVTFDITGIMGARRGVIKKARSAMDLIEAKQYEIAQIRIDEVFTEKELNLYEAARLRLLQYQIDLANNDERAALRNLYRAWSGDGKNLERRLRKGVLLNMFALELNQQRYGNALRTYEKLKELKDGLDGQEKITEVVIDINAMIANTRPIGVDGIIEDRCNCDEGEPNWTYELLRKEIGFQDVAGRIERIELWCDYRKFVDTNVGENNWKIPEDWGQCDLYVYGDEGTTFKLVEYSK